MGLICRNKNGEFVIFPEHLTPKHLKRQKYTVERGAYNNYYNDYEEIRHYTNEYEDKGVWCVHTTWGALNEGINISDENVPEKYKDMTYNSEPRKI